MLKGMMRRRPSASMVVAILALVVAASGTAVAATQMNGNSLIKKHSLSGNRLKNHTITGKQVNLKKLGKVPSAKHADSATTATTASNSNELGGQPSSAFLASGSRIGTNGIVKETGTASGATETVFTSGPFTVKLVCTKDSSGDVTAELDGYSSEANSDIDGTLEATANTPVDLLGAGPSTTFSQSDDVNFDFEAPSGAQALIIGALGINSLGTDCWTNWAGIH